MHWALYPHTYTLYGYSEPGGLEARKPYLATGQVEIIGGRMAFLHATLRNGQPLGPRDWRDVARLLAAETPCTQIMAERSGELVTWRIARVPLR